MNTLLSPSFARIAFVLCAWAPLFATGQDDEFSESSDVGLIRVQHGEGIQISFPDEQYLFALEGLAQPGVQWRTLDLDSTSTLGTFVRRAYMTFRAVDEDRGLTAVVRGDFTQAQPLLDAYIDFRPQPHWWLRFGQFQQIANNREMLFYEGNLSMPERSLVSRLFSQTGREFGLAIGGHWGKEGGLLVRPMLAVTSGDGLNSFGTLSNDSDRGGLKYAGRLDLLPFGDFDAESAVDFERTATVRMAVGIATSYNDGASGPVGESHGEWALYDADGNQQLPGYLKNVVDVLAKYRGFTFLGEYVNAAAFGLDGSYTNAALGTLLMPTEISTYLMLGNAYNAQMGYCFANGWAVDARFGQTFPEFAAEQPASQLQVVDALGGCLTWHRNEQALKLQLAADYWNYPDLPTNSGWFMTFQTQIQF